MTGFVNSKNMKANFQISLCVSRELESAVAYDEDLI